MNERIRELIKEADRKCSETKGVYDEILVQLVVLECMSLCEDLKAQQAQFRKEEMDFGMKNIYAEGEATCEHLQKKMKKHFGVKK